MAICSIDGSIPYHPLSNTYTFYVDFMMPFYQQAN